MTSQAEPHNLVRSHLVSCGELCICTQDSPCYDHVCILCMLTAWVKASLKVRVKVSIRIRVRCRIMVVARELFIARLIYKVHQKTLPPDVFKFKSLPNAYISCSSTHALLHFSVYFIHYPAIYVKMSTYLQFHLT